MAGNAELKVLYDASVAAKERLDAAMTATPLPQQEVLWHLLLDDVAALIRFLVAAVAHHEGEGNLDTAKGARKDLACYEARRALIAAKYLEAVRPGSPSRHDEENVQWRHNVN